MTLEELDNTKIDVLNSILNLQIANNIMTNVMYQHFKATSNVSKEDIDKYKKIAQDNVLKDLVKID